MSIIPKSQPLTRTFRRRTKTDTNPNLRRALTAGIHAERKKRGMDDFAYRLLLAQYFSAESSKTLNNRQLGELLDLIKGNENEPKKRVLWLIQEACKLQGYGAEYLDGMADRMFKKGFQLLTHEELCKVLSALRYDARRKARVLEEASGEAQSQPETQPEMGGLHA